MSGGRVALLGAALVLAAGAGCGDDRKDRERTAFHRYKTKVEAACDEAVRRIRERGAPADMSDLSRLGAPALDDIHRLARAVQRLKEPPGAARRLGAFREDLGVLDRRVQQQRDYVDRAAPAEVVADEVGGLVTVVANVEFSAKEAGIRCVAPRDREQLETVAMGPVFFAWFLAFQHYAHRKLAPFEHPLIGSPADVRHVVEGEVAALLKLQNRLDAMRSPGYARDEVVDFEVEFSTYQDVLTDAAERLRGRAVVSDAFARRFNRRLRRQRARVQRTEARLLRALVRPLPKPPGPSTEAKPA